MKPETAVWLLCESVGKPADKLKMHGTVRECLMAASQWLVSVYMGSKIRITMARTESDLIESKKSAELEDMQGELAKMLGGTPESETETEHA